MIVALTELFLNMLIYQNTTGCCLLKLINFYSIASAFILYSLICLLWKSIEPESSHSKHFHLQFHIQSSLHPELYLESVSGTVMVRSSWKRI